MLIVKLSETKLLLKGECNEIPYNANISWWKTFAVFAD